MLVTCSGTRIRSAEDLERMQPFVVEQARSIQECFDVEIDYFLISRPGVRGYRAEARRLQERLTVEPWDLVHAHYGLTGFAATMQRRRPVVVTYHGSDTVGARNRFISSLAGSRAAWRIFVSPALERRLLSPRDGRSSVIPCGVDLDLFRSIPRDEARAMLGWSGSGLRVLFAAGFDNAIKNPELARAAVQRLPGVELIELKGVERNRVPLLINASDALLLTSFREGSPQVVKEAMACGIPIVSTEVGDVRRVIGDTAGCAIVPPEVEAVSAALERALHHGERTNGRERVVDYGLKRIAEQVHEVYREVLHAAA